MEKEIVKRLISQGEIFLGLEFGATRIKATLTDKNAKPIAEGSFTWENQLKDGIWTYPLDLIHQGLRSCYKDLKQNVQKKYGLKISKIKGMGISAMMHGYLAFDKNDRLLVPFRTWRNTITQKASETLSKLFSFPIPQRWTISHLYQAILNDEEHVKEISYVMTLASYIHFLLTGEKVTGAGDASGIFPIQKNKDNSIQYNENYQKLFEELPEVSKRNIKINEIFPKIKNAGEEAGHLTKEGAKFLDPEGDLSSISLFCPPEGDAGTGMVATNAVKSGSGNISAGTSIFAMVVLEKNLKKSYPGIIDIVTTPDALSVAMVHANNCTGELNCWVCFIKEAVETVTGINDIPLNTYYEKLISKGQEADKDLGGLLSYNYLSGESITDFSSGRPLFVRSENAVFTLSNFMKSQMFACLASLRIGMEKLYDENVKIKRMTGAGGYFKTKEGLDYMAAALQSRIDTMENSGEGGPWGMAILAIYADYCKSEKSLSSKNPLTLGDFLAQKIFSKSKVISAEPKEDFVQSFEIFLDRYKKGLAIEKAAVENL